MHARPQPPIGRLLTVILALTLVLAGCVGPAAEPTADAEPNPAPAPTSDNTTAEDRAADDNASRTDRPPPSSGNATDPGDGEATPENGSAQEEDEVPPEPRTIQHAGGETTIEGRTERVVALEFNHVESVLALGEQPVGVADKDGYQKWVDPGIELDEAVQDVGTRAEPNLEEIASLEPNLILAIEFRHADIYDDLSEIAPTLLFEAFPDSNESGDQFARMVSIFERTAEAMAREDKGQAVLEGMNDHFEAVRNELEAEDRTGREILVSQLFTYQGQPLARVFLDTSIGVNVAERIGLENAWTKKSCSTGYGYCDVSKEGFIDVQHADFYYQAQPNDDPVEDEWSDDPVWNSYEFVQEDRVYPLGAETWLFGGPLVSQKIADRLAQPHLG